MASLRKSAMARSHKSFTEGQDTKRSSSRRDSVPSVTKSATTEPRNSTKSKRRRRDEPVTQKMVEQKEVGLVDGSKHITEKQNPNLEISTVTDTRQTKKEIVGNDQVKVDRGKENSEKIGERKKSVIIDDTRRKLSIDYDSQRKELLCKLSECAKKEECISVALRHYDTTIEHRIKYTNLKDNFNELRQLAITTKEDWQKKCNEIDDLKKQLEYQQYMYEEKVEKLENNHKDLLESKAGTMEKKELMQQNIDHLMKLNKMFEEKEYKLIIEKEQLDNRIIELEKINSEALEKIKEFDEEVLLVRKTVEDEKLANSDLVAATEQLTNNVTEVEHIKVKLEQKVGDLSNKIIELEKINSEALEKIKKLDEEVLLVKKTVEDEKLANSDLVAAREQLTNNVTEVEHIKVELEQKVDDLSNKIVELEKVNSEAVEKNKELDEEVLLVRKTVEDEKLANSDLEGKLKDLKDYHIKLEKMNSNLTKENMQMCQQMAEKQDEKTASNILNLLSPLVHKESNKYIFMNDSIVKWNKYDDIDIHKLSLYENVICDLQEVIDFYCLLSGISVSKSKCYNLDSNELAVRNGRFTQFHCQLNPSWDGYRFIMNVDFEGQEVKYSPDSSTDKMLMPKVLQDPIDFNFDQPYIFLKGLLENI